MTEKYCQSYAKGKEDVYEPKYHTVPEFLRHHSKVRPDKTAFVFLSTDGPRQTVIWKEVYTKSVQMAKSLVELGVKRKELVAISVRDSPEWLFIHYGIIMAGAIPFGLSFMTPDGSDVAALLKRVENCRAIFLDPGPNNYSWNIFKTFVESMDGNGNVTSSKITSLRYCVCMFKPNDATNVLSLSELETMAKEDTQLPTIHDDDIQILFQSSGSTGVPKVIAHTHKSLINSVRFFKLAGMTGDDDDVIYNGLPFRWMGGYIWNVYNGETRVTRSGLCKIPDNMSEFVFNAILQENVTVTFTLLSFVDALMKRELPAEWPLRTINTGGQPVARHFASCIEKGVAQQLCILYSSSEATTACFNMVKRSEDFIEYACGRPLPAVEVKVISKDGDIVPPYTRGELCIRSEGMFKCYYNDEESTKIVLSEDGWYRSGDVGYMTDNGIFYVEGRISDTIYSGGIPVSPAIMETVLNSYKGVKSSMIVPVPDDTLQHAVCACFIPTSGSDVTEDNLRLYLVKVSAERPQLFAVLPKYFVKFDAFPETDTGKASRKLLATDAERRLKK